MGSDRSKAYASNFGPQLVLPRTVENCPCRLSRPVVIA